MRPLQCYILEYSVSVKLVEVKELLCISYARRGDSSI